MINQPATEPTLPEHSEIVECQSAPAFLCRAAAPFNTSLEPTGVGAVSSVARFTSQVAGGSVLGR